VQVGAGLYEIDYLGGDRVAVYRIRLGTRTRRKATAGEARAAVQVLSERAGHERMRVEAERARAEARSFGVLRHRAPGMNGRGSPI
jgi:hypothetical protein